MKIILPFPLPTWNRVLGMNRWERKKLRDLTDKLIFTFIQSDIDLQTPAGFALNTLSTRLLIQEYLLMIRPDTSRSRPTAKKKYIRRRVIRKKPSSK